MEEVLKWIEDHPILAAVLGIGGLLLILWLLGFFSKPSTGSANLAGAYYAAEAAQTTAATQLQMATVQATNDTAKAGLQAQAAQAIAATNANAAMNIAATQGTTATTLGYYQADTAKTLGYYAADTAKTQAYYTADVQKTLGNYQYLSDAALYNYELNATYSNNATALATAQNNNATAAQIAQINANASTLNTAMTTIIPQEVAARGSAQVGTPFGQFSVIPSGAPSINQLTSEGYSPAAAAYLAGASIGLTWPVNSWGTG